jgi:REP element-mobilizing transposase RayT
MRHSHKTVGMRHASGTSKPGYAALRKGRYSLAGQIYLVTFTTRSRRSLFADPEFARIASHALVDPRLWQDAHLRAWVLMPDHWHGLIELGTRHDLSAVVRNLKSNTARRIRLVHPDMR